MRIDDTEAPARQILLDRLYHPERYPRDEPGIEHRPDAECSRLAAVIDRLRRFVAAPLADLIVDGDEEALRSHRRDVTVVFLDLRGFTAFVRSVEPEDVMAVLHGYHQVIGRLVSAQRGMLERFAGDGMMIYFNDPVPVPDPQRRAVVLAAAAHEQVAALAHDWGRWGSHLALAIGISHGFATVGRIGFEERYDYAAIGSVTNLASRLCARARAGETLVCERVMSAVEHHVEADMIGPIRLRGFHRPQRVFRITALTAV